MRWIDGTDLVQWADRRDSQALLPELIRQLVYATAPDARRVEFRTGEGVQLPGWDVEHERLPHLRLNAESIAPKRYFTFPGCGTLCDTGVPGAFN